MRVFFACLIVLFFGEQGGYADSIAYLYALEADGVMLKKRAASGGQSFKVGDTQISRMAISGHTVYAAKMGAGCVETAIATQAILTKFRCDYLITTGVVGTLSPKRKIGEWGEVESVTAYQRGSETPNGFQLSPAASKKFLSPKSAPWTPKEISQGLDKMRVVSGETFCASDTYRDKLAAQSTSDVIDMNLFGLVTVASQYNIPVIVWRVVSDNAGDDASKEFYSFTQKYNGTGGTWVAEWIKKLPKNLANPESYDNLNKLIQE